MGPYQLLAGRLGYPNSKAMQRILRSIMPNESQAEIAIELPTPVDELAENMDVSEEKIQQIIKDMELRGIIGNTSRGYFFVRNIVELRKAIQAGDDQVLDDLWEEFLNETGKKGPILTFSKLVKGEELGPMERTVTSGESEKLIKSISIKDPWYWEKTSGGVQIAPPIWGARFYYILLASKYDLTGSQRFTGILLSQEDEYFFPIEIGSKVILKGRISDKKSMRGRNYATIEMEARDKNGSIFGRYRSTVEIIIN